MGSVFNNYSLLWISVLLLIVLGLLLFRQKPGLSNIIAFAVILMGLVFAWMTIRPRQTPLMENARAVQAKIGQGLPVLLEFQSPY